MADSHTWRLTDQRAIAGVIAYGSRIFLGLIFLTGGVSKLMPFPGVMGPVWLEHELAQYGLGTYARFIGWSEALIGALLLSRPFATLGAIMLVPLVINILMVTVSLHWRGTPYVVSGFLAMNLYLLIYDFDKWKSVIGMAPGSPVESPSPGRRVGVVVAVACIAALTASPLVFPAIPTAAYVLSGVALAALLTEPVWRRAFARHHLAESALPVQ